MSTSDNNLLAFLKNQSLFSKSPGKNINRKMSSRSREKKVEQVRQSNNFIVNEPLSPVKRLNLSGEVNYQNNLQDNNKSFHQNPNLNQTTFQNNFGQFQGGSTMNGQLY